MAATKRKPTMICAISALSALLLALIISSVLAPRTAGAEDYAVAESYVHAFSNGSTVFTELFALNIGLSLDTSIYAKYTVDLIAPGLFEGPDDGDVVSGASSSAGGTDTRNEITVGTTHNFAKNFSLALYYDLSIEKDFESSTPSLSLTKELFNKNTLLSFGYSQNSDDISGRFMGSTKTRTTDNYYLGLTQIISPVTIIQGGYSLIKSVGEMGEGIRLVPVDGASASSCEDLSATCVAEALPGEKERKAYILGLNHYFKKDDSSLKLTFRYYWDDWDIESYTAEIEHYRRLSERNMLKLNYRFYTQTSSYFYKDNFVSADPLKTASPQHKSFDTHLAGAKIIRKLKRPRSFGPFELGRVEGKYELYLESSGVHAHIFMLSLNLTPRGG